MNTELPGGRKEKFDTEKLRKAIEEEYDDEAPQPAKSAFASKDSGSRIRIGAHEGGYVRLSEADAEREQAARREELKADFDRRSFSFLLRFSFSLFITVLLIWIETAATYGFTMPAYISVNRSSFAFVAGDVTLFLISAVLCGPLILKGTASLFTLRPDTDSLVSLSFIGAALLDAFLLVNPSSFTKGGMMIYSGAASALLTANLLSCCLEFRRASSGLDAFPESGRFYTLRKIRLRDALPSIPEGEDGFILCPARENALEDYAGNVFSATPADRVSRVLSPILFAAAAASLAVNMVMGRGIYAALASFSAVCCIGSPACFTLGISIPFVRTAGRLKKINALVTGHDSIREIKNADTVLADAGFLFPPETVAIHGIKAFSGEKIEKAILDAASLACASDIPLSAAFRNLIEAESLDSLESVGNITVHDDQGVSGISAGRLLLLGNRDLLRANGVEAPSREYEAKYAAEGREILYFAVGRQLHAMFIVGYYSDRETLSSLKKIDRKGFSLFVKTSDPNITASLIADRIGESRAGVSFLNAKEARSLQTAAESSLGTTGLSFSGRMKSYSGALLSAVRLGGIFRAVTALQVAESVIGAIFILLCSVTGGVASFTSVKAAAFQGIWAAAAVFIGLFI